MSKAINEKSIIDKLGSKIFRVEGKSLQYVAALIASISTFSTGLVLAWTSQIVPSLMDGELGFKVNSHQIGWIGSLMPLGAAIFSIMAGGLSEYVGRKMFMIYTVIPMVVGWFLLMFANGVTMLYIGRFITGMVAGSYCVMSPLYSVEISQKEIRGTLGSFTQMMISCGVLFVATISKYLSIVDFTKVCASVSIVFAFLFVLMPESPVYLLKANREEDARNALQRLRGKNFNLEDEILTIKAFLKENSSITFAVIKESLKKTSVKRAIVIIIGLMAFRVLCGIDAITTYASYNFQQAGVAIDAETCTIILAAIQTVSGIFQSAVVDRLGRKILLLISALMMGICLFLVGISVLLKERDILAPGNYKVLNYLPIIGLCLFPIGYSLGLGPIPWMITGEIFPHEIKSVASSVSGFLSWIFTFIIINSFLSMVNNIGQDYTFFIFAGFCAVSVVFTYVFVKETKGKTFDEIQQDLSR